MVGECVVLAGPSLCTPTGGKFPGDPLFCAAGRGTFAVIGNGARHWLVLEKARL